MPLQIIRQDITKMKVDAIVNPSNRHLRPTGGADLLIHKKAGPRLSEACEKLGGCPVGSAKLTPAFKLPCKYVIHTAGPDWYREKDAEKLLISCYESCLILAEENNCETIAFPLISSGAYGYPRDKVLKVAINTISTFLFDNEMTVYLLVYDKESYELSGKLFSGIESYIDDNYVAHYRKIQCNTAIAEKRRVKEFEYECISSDESVAGRYEKKKDRLFPCASVLSKQKLEFAVRLDESFAVKLVRLIDAKGISDVECYKKANVSKQTWHKLMTDKHYKPNKKTAISFAVALELSLDETQQLLESLGFVLSNSSLFDVIIKYCLENEIYDVFEIDSVLFKYDQETLFSRL